MQDKDYTVTFVEARGTYPTAYGDMQAYALKLDGVDGFVQLGQKPETPAPVVGNTLHGHTYEQPSKNGPFLKFKKVNPAYASMPATASKPVDSEESAYQTKLLEAIANAVGASDAVKKKEDVAPDDIDDEPIDLSEIPF